MVRVSITWLTGLLFVAPALAQQNAPAPTTPAAPAPAVAAPAPLPAPNAVAATVNGQPIPEMAVYRALRPVPEAKKAEARVEILNFLIDNVLLDQYLKQQKVDIEAKEVDAQVAKMRSQLKENNQDFDKVLQQMFLTENELREHISAELRWEKYCSGQANDAALRDMFTKNPEMFDGSLVHARHILLTIPAPEARTQLLAMKAQLEAAVAKELAKQPANTDNLAKQQMRAEVLEKEFGTLAKQKSTCPSKEQGGDVGWFPRAGNMVEPFAKVAFALKPYELSDVVTTQFGSHLILCVGRKAGKETKFEEAKEMVKEVYGARMRESLLAQLRPAAKITK